MAADRFSFRECDGQGGDLWQLHPRIGGKRHRPKQCGQQQPSASRNEHAPKGRGVRWKILPGASLVASVFDLQKIYFNLDPSNVFRKLGEMENKGVELSLSGSLTDQIDVVAGAVLSEPRVSGEAVRLGISGDRPVGIRSRKFIFDANWSPRGLTGFSFDLGVNHYGSVAASLNNVAVIPAFTTVDWDARYGFKMAGQAASLKFAVMNMFNVRSLRAQDADIYSFFFNSGRRIDLRLIVDMT